MLPAAGGMRVHGEGGASGAVRGVRVGLWLTTDPDMCQANTYPLRVAKHTAPRHAVIRLHLDKKRVETLNAGAADKVTVHSPLYKTCG